MLLATRCALASPLVSATAVEASNFALEADRHGVHHVPAVIVNDRPAWTGGVREEEFVTRLVAAGR